MNITNFKNGFNGGTRANRFTVSGGLGSVSTGTSNAIKNYQFHIRSTFIPPITNITLEMHGYGRKLHIPGDRQYAPWQLTIYDDRPSGSESSGSESGTILVPDLWQKFVDWQTAINAHDTNTTSLSGAPGYLNYKNDWNIDHLDLNGTILKSFKLIGCWPKSVSDIDFNMTRRNFLNTFSVIMLYDSIDIVGLDSIPAITAG